MNYGVKLKTLNNMKKTYESSMGHSKLASLSQRSLSSHNSRGIVSANPKKQVRLACAFHSDQRITNFCRSKGCLLPLCPRCVTIHTQEHIKLGVYAEFTTIEDEINSSQMQIRLGLQKMSQLESIINQKKQEFQAQITAGKQAIKHGRIQIHQKVDDIFDILQNAWTAQLQLINKQKLEEIEHMEEYLPSLAEVASVGLMKLKNSQYILEAVITNFSFLEEIHRLEQAQQNIKTQQIERISVNFEKEQLNNLIDCLSRYISWGKNSQEVWMHIQSIYNQVEDRGLPKPNKSLRKMVASHKRENILQKVENENQELAKQGAKSQIAEKRLTLDLGLDNFKSPLQTFSLEDLRKNHETQV